MKKLTFLIHLLPVLLNAQTVIVLEVEQPPALSFEISSQDVTIFRSDSVKIGTGINIFGGSGNYTYNWSPAEFLDDSTILTPFAFPQDTTEYFLTVTDAEGCSFSTTFTVNVQEKTTDIQATRLQDDLITAKLYPNPNNGRFKIELSGKYNGAIELTIIDNTGRTVYQNRIRDFNQTHLETVDVKLPQGIYNLLVHSKNQKIQKQFVIN